MDMRHINVITDKTERRITGIIPHIVQSVYRPKLLQGHCKDDIDVRLLDVNTKNCKPLMIKLITTNRSQIMSNFLWMNNFIPLEKYKYIHTLRMVAPIIMCLTPIASITATTARQVDLKDASRYAIYADNAVVDGDKLRIDTNKSSGTWILCMKTRPGYFKAGNNYRVKVNCHTESAEKDAYMLFVMRPYVKNNGPYDDIASRIVPDIAGPSQISFDFTIPDGRNDYALQVYSRGKIKATVGDIFITQMPELSYIPASTSEQSIKIPNVPDGAKEFTISLPDPSARNVFSVTDFGASPDAEDNTAAFQKAINACAGNPGSRLIVPKGIYHFNSPNALKFKELHNFELDGQGSTFIVMNKIVFLDINACHRTRFHNFNIDWNWQKDPLSCVVKVEKIGPGKKWADFRFVHYEKFPITDPHIVMIDKLDSNTMSVGHRGSFNVVFPNSLRTQKRNWIEPDLLRLNYDFNGVDLLPGQLFRMIHYYYANGGKCFSLKDNADQTLDNINMYSYRGCGIAVRGEQRRWQLRNSNITIPANDKTRSITCTADLIHFSNSGGFCKIESCNFGYGNDDCINIKDFSFFAVKSGDKSIRTRKLNSWLLSYFNKGDKIELRNIDYSPSSFTATLGDIKTIDPTSGIYEMTFDKQVPQPKSFGFIGFNWRYDSRNFIISNCKFHDNRGRGVVIQARDVTVNNCSFNNQQSGAIHIKTGFTFDHWREGYGASNIVIRNCSFSEVNPWGRYPNALRPDIYIGTYVMVDSPNAKTSYQIMNNILIDANRFIDTTGAAIYMNSATNVFVLNNIIENNLKHQNIYKYRGAIGASESSNIYISGNRWHGKYNYLAGFVYDAATVTNTHMGENTDEAIIKKSQ